jgi:hypothetical protein
MKWYEAFLALGQEAYINGSCRTIVKVALAFHARHYDANSGKCGSLGQLKSPICPKKIGFLGYLR